MTSLWFALAVGIVIGAALGWLARSAHAGGDVTPEQAGKLSAAEARALAYEKQMTDLGQTVKSLQGQLTTLQVSHAGSEAQLGEREKSLEAQGALLAEAEKKLSSTFEALAAKALRESNQGFLQLAKEKLDGVSLQAVNELEARKVAVENLVNPITQVLNEYKNATAKLEIDRAGVMGEVGEQLHAVATANASLQAETSKLVQALSQPKVRGAWGEIALQRTAELAGLTLNVDFELQVSTASDDGSRVQPDMVVNLPANRQIIVDSKVSLQAYLVMLEATTKEDREKAQDRHAEQLKKHVLDLARTDYSKSFPKALDFVIMFVPNDSFLAAAAERQPGLIEDAASRRVIIATPTTLIALLRAIEFGWRQERLAQNAEEISELGKELAQRIAVFVGHIARVGDKLMGALDAYNDAAGSYKGMLLPQARRLEQLGAKGRTEIPDLSEVEGSLRRLNAKAEETK